MVGTKPDLPQEAGTYALILHCPVAGRLVVGRWGELALVTGWYLYVGSACGPGGLRARCGRHARGGRAHWHIDYVRPLCRLQEIWFVAERRRREHQWADLLRQTPGVTLPAPGFGSSDCSCASHLFRTVAAPSLSRFRQRVRRALPDHGPIHRWVDESPG